MIKTYICVIILVYYFKRGENLKHSFKKVMENTQVNYKIGFKDIAKTFIELVSGKKSEQSKSEEETEKRIKEIEKIENQIGATERINSLTSELENHKESKIRKRTPKVEKNQSQITINKSQKQDIKKGEEEKIQEI